MQRMIGLILTYLALNCLLYGADLRFVTIDVPNASSTNPLGVNARGDIVGRYGDANGVTHGFLLRNGSFTTIDFPLPGALFTSARAINARGEIAGTVIDASGTQHGYLLHDGNFTQIDFPGATDTSARGINDVGEITGRYFDATGDESGWIRRTDGTFQSIRVPDSCSTDVWMIMDNGRVLVGDHCTNPDFALHGFLRDKSGNFQTLDFPTGGQFPCSAARWINERQDIVGLYAIANNVDECYGATEIHGFLLRDRSYTAIDVPGAVSTDVLAINNDGKIVGDYTDKNGVTHGFRATFNGGR